MGCKPTAHCSASWHLHLCLPWVSVCMCVSTSALPMCSGVGIHLHGTEKTKTAWAIKTKLSNQHEQQGFSYALRQSIATTFNKLWSTFEQIHERHNTLAHKKKESVRKRRKKGEIYDVKWSKANREFNNQYVNIQWRILHLKPNANQFLFEFVFIFVQFSHEFRTVFTAFADKGASGI